MLNCVDGFGLEIIEDVEERLQSIGYPRAEALRNGNRDNIHMCCIEAFVDSFPAHMVHVQNVFEVIEEIAMLLARLHSLVPVVVRDLITVSMNCIFRCQGVC